MAAQPMDALKSFVYLTDNIPPWTSKLEDLSSHAAQKNAEFVAEYTRLVKKIKPKRIKSPSISSIHSTDDKSLNKSAPLTEDLPSPPEKADIDPLVAGNKYLYAQAQRKRKPGSSVRSGASGPQKFRSKHQVVIYYDSHVQDELDSMVKALGIARNNLRKGRNSLAMSRGFQLPTFTRRNDAITMSSSSENLQNTASKVGQSYGNKNIRGIRQNIPASDDEAAFMQTDKELETVQSICETAAHQFLRDGDCKAELDSVVKLLGDILVQAKSTIESLKKLKEEEEESNTTHTPNEVETPASSHLDLSVASDKLTATALSQTIEDMKAHQASNIKPPVLAVEDMAQPISSTMEIEVDDNESDDDSIVVDLGKYRLMRTTRIRV